LGLNHNRSPWVLDSDKGTRHARNQGATGKLSPKCFKNIVKVPIIFLFVKSATTGYNQFDHPENFSCLRPWCVLSPLIFIFYYMNWMDSINLVNEFVAFGNCGINRLLFSDDWVLLTSSEQGLQHAIDRFSAACGQMGMKRSTKKTRVPCLSRNPMQCTLQVSGNTL